MSKKSSNERRPARERLLQAAGALFYEEGFNAVGIDRVIERAGVAKASLYDCFGSKEELVRSYLLERAAARRVRVETTLAAHRTPRARILGLFDALAGSFERPDFRGCAFVRADTEIRPGGTACAVLGDARAWMRGVFEGEATELGATDPSKLARQLVILYDGASVSAQMDRDPGAAGAARDAAEALVDAAVNAGLR